MFLFLLRGFSYADGRRQASRQQGSQQSFSGQLSCFFTKILMHSQVWVSFCSRGFLHTQNKLSAKPTDIRTTLTLILACIVYKNDEKGGGMSEILPEKMFEVEALYKLASSSLLFLIGYWWILSEACWRRILNIKHVGYLQFEISCLLLLRRIKRGNPVVL